MNNPDRLYDLLPAVYRQRDADQGYPLQALLRVVAEQVDLVEADIAGLYENWFIETCDDWVVPYIGDLVGYEVLNDAGEPASVGDPRGRRRERILIPRRDVANTIHARRRKGTLALLAELARDVAGWPAHPVECFRHLGWTQNLHTPLLGRPRLVGVRIGDTLAAIAARAGLTEAALLWLNPAVDPGRPLVAGTPLLVGWRSARGGTADLRDAGALDRLDGPFDRTARTVDVRRIDSHRGTGRFNIPSIGEFVWRLQPYTVGWQGVAAGAPPPPSRAPAYCCEDRGPQCFTFSVLGNDTPLFNRPAAEPDPDRMPSELDLPAPIRRIRFAERPADYYGPAASLCIWAPDWPVKGAGLPVPASAIRVADLDGWSAHAANGTIAVDPERGRMVFPVRQLPKQGLTVLYTYGFSANLGGGEYDRTLSQPADARIYFVGSGGDYPTISAALAQWNADKQALAAATAPDGAPASARPSIAGVIEITDSAAYTEKLILRLDPYESLQIRASQGRRPTIRLLDYLAPMPDAFAISGGPNSRFTLDGLLITGRGLQVNGPDPAAADGAPAPGDLCDVTIRHCTLVPGWGLDCNCDPTRPSEPSIEISNSTAKIRIEHSILGAIRIVADEAATDPVELCLSDSLWDATDGALFALSGPDDAAGYARLTIARCTVFGRILAHEIALAENTIFDDPVCTARRQGGCVRFCYVPPGSRTPRRFECQPDLVRQAVADRFARGAISAAVRDVELAAETSRVEPDFNSIRYGAPAYGQLAGGCAPEITTGADDESELGAFHDLFQPQRAANLRARLETVTPAGMDAGIINAT